MKMRRARPILARGIEGRLVLGPYKRRLCPVCKRPIRYCRVGLAEHRECEDRESHSPSDRDRRSA